MIENLGINLVTSQVQSTTEDNTVLQRESSMNMCSGTFLYVTAHRLEKSCRATPSSWSLICVGIVHMASTVLDGYRLFRKKKQG